MAVSPFDSVMAGGLFGDAELAAFFSDEAEIAAMIAFEAALADVEGALGVIPADEAARIVAALGDCRIAPDALRAGFASAGVPVPALVKALRAHVGGEAGSYVHWGATSQDVIDTGLVLRLSDVLAVLEGRLASVIAVLSGEAERYAGTVMAARTRSQIATPTTFGLRIAGWIAPLQRCQARLAELKPRLLVVQLGGASGTLSVFGGQGVAVMGALAVRLGLGCPVKPWHSERDALVELAGWLSLVTGTLGKMGADLMLLGRSEIGEVKAGQGGGSSTMPQKSNPVSAETLVTLARFNATQVSGAHLALVHSEERDSTAWALEWMILPQMVMATGAALRHAHGLASSLDVDAARMRANAMAGGGTILAEAASFALATQMPLSDAQALVNATSSEAARSGRTLVDILSEEVPDGVDWDAVGDAEAHIGGANELIKLIKNAQ